MKHAHVRPSHRSWMAGLVVGAFLGSALIAEANSSAAPPVVQGLDTAVIGIAKRTNGTGVLGKATGPMAAGVEGRVEGVGTGVSGYGAVGVQGVSSDEGGGAGVVGVHSSTIVGPGVRIIALGDTPGRPLNIGRLGTPTSSVEGVSNLAEAVGVRGKHRDITEGILGGRTHAVEARYRKDTEALLGGPDTAAQMRHGKLTEVFLADRVNAVVGKSTAAGGKGVAGSAEGGKDAVAIYGQSTAGHAGFFKGNVTIQGTLMAQQVFAPKGLVGSGAKLFKIDHPLAPGEKYLAHASVESDALKNMYDGVATLGPNGTAWVTLPDWFQALNKDFRYQLTCVGGYAAVYVAKEIANNRFQIAGGKPGLKVSWQVTGVRQDAVARANPLRVEEEKSPGDRGRYLNPIELGFPESRRIGAGNIVSIKP